MSAIALVCRQAEEEGLWFEATQITEKCLQKALRELHEAVEADHRERLNGISVANDGPYVIQDHYNGAADRVCWIAIDPSTGIMAAADDMASAQYIADALNTEHKRWLDLLLAIKQCRDYQRGGYDVLASNEWDEVCRLADRMSHSHNPKVDHRNPTQ